MSEWEHFFKKKTQNSPILRGLLVNSPILRALLTNSPIFTCVSCASTYKKTLSLRAHMKNLTDMGRLWWVGLLNLQVSFAKKPYKRDNILQKRPIILSILLTVATPYLYVSQTLYSRNSATVGMQWWSRAQEFGVCVCVCVCACVVVCVCAWVYVCVCVWGRVWLCVYFGMQRWSCAQEFGVCLRVYVWVCVRVGVVCVCVCVYVCVYVCV